MKISHYFQRSLFSLIFGAFLISFSGVWVKLAHVSPTVSGFYRVFFGFLFLLPATFLRGEITSRPMEKYFLSAVCALFFALDLYFWHASVKYIGPGLSTILTNFQVFGMALIGALFFKEKVRIIFIVSVPLALFGIFLIIGFNWNQLGTDYKTGIYYGLAAAAFYVGFLLSLRKLQSDHTDFSIFFYLMAVSFFCSLFLGGMVIFEGHSFIVPDINSLLYLIGLGLFSQFVGWVMIANAIPRIHASVTGLILLLQPSLAFIWDVLFFSRKTDLVNWSGVIIALTAIYLGMTGSPPPRAGNKNA